MSNYAIGRRLEYKTMRVLEAAGYLAIRSAGSHSPFDVIGVGSDVLFIQVKGGRLPPPSEMEELREFYVPKGCRKLIHVWKPRQSTPLVKEIR